MTVNQSFQNWTVVTDEPGEQLIFEHDGSGERVTLDQDGSISAAVSNPDRVPNNGGDFKAKDGRGVRYFDPQQEGSAIETYRYIRDTYLPDEGDRTNVGYIELPIETVISVDGTTLNLTTSSSPGYSDLTVRGFSGSADGGARLPNGRFDLTNQGNTQTGVRIRNISSQYTVEGITAHVSDGSGGPNSYNVRFDLMEDNQSAHQIGAVGGNGTGIYHNGGRGFQCTKYMVNNCGAAGVLIEEVTDSSFAQAEVESSGGSGVKLLNAEGVEITAFIVEQSGSDGCVIDGCVGVQIRNSEMSVAPNHSCLITNGSSRVTVKNCYLDQGGVAGATVDNATDVHLVGNRITSSNEHIRITDSANNKRIVVTGNQYNGSGTNVAIKGPSPVDVYVDNPTINGEQNVNPGSSTYTLSFDTSFSHYPRIPITADQPVNSFTNWATDANGNYTSVDVTFSATPSAVSWEAIPRNIGV